MFIVSATTAAVERGADAGRIVREAAQAAGGNGGGRKDMAQAGGKDIAKTSEALQKASTVAKEMIGKR
jgi:alanyl-tRNA synthetase